ncbi:MAG: SMP-30/gluconolactonase/LRE family protein [Nitrospirae bacterium]|nr:SMP-30/gluconolactonase/LRE family protein [Nitrospirota bacterium]
MSWKKIVLILLTVTLINSGSIFAATDDHGHEQKKVAAPAAKTDKLFNEFYIPTPYSQPYKIAADHNGIIWFVEQSSNKLGKFDPMTSKFTEYLVPSAKDIGSSSWKFSETERKTFTGGYSVSSAGSLAGLAIDSKGNVWFTVLLGNKIGKFAPNKEEFSEYTVPTDSSGPFSLAIDSMDNIWFTERNANKIGKWDADVSSFKEYSIQTPNSKPAGIAVDKKDNVWFVMSDANKIGMIEPATGKFNEYKILTPMANANDIAVDSKGNIWFTEVSANKLGMFSIQMNRFDEAVIPTLSSVPMNLAIDKYDRIWFTENKGNKIGMFDPATAIFKEHDIPTNQSFPLGITIDHSGNIWFVESDREVNKIAYVAGLAAAPPKSSEAGTLSASDKKFGAQFVIIIIISVMVITILMSYFIMSFRKANKRL